MRRISLLWSLFWIVPAVAPAAPAQADRALSLIGSWSCQSLAKTTSTMTFSRQPDGTMAMLNAYKTADGVVGQFDETYRFDSDSGDWIWNTGDSATGSTEGGVAPRWTGNAWTFTGTRRVSAKRAESIRMVYTRVTDTAFRREFFTDRNGTWATTSTSVCKRA